MAVLETLEDLRELNAANAGIDPKILITAEEEYNKQLEILQKQEDEDEIKRMFSKRNSDFNEPVNEGIKMEKNFEYKVFKRISSSIEKLNFL
jgi:hypothetical protein